MFEVWTHDWWKPSTSKRTNINLRFRWPGEPVFQLGELWALCWTACSESLTIQFWNRVTIMWGHNELLLNRFCLFRTSMLAHLFICSSQSSGGGGPSATVRANKTCRSHSFITLRAFWLSYRGTGVGVTVSTSIRDSESLQGRKNGYKIV